MRIHWADDPEGGISIAEVGFSHEKDAAVRDQFNVLMEALTIYAERNVRYKDNWRRMGWRGVLVRIRERSERLWDEWWERAQRPTTDDDNALDLINFAAIFIRAQRGETDRDGSWW